MKQRRRKSKVLNTEENRWSEPQDIPLVRIIRDPNIQPRKGLDVKLWNQYKTVFRVYNGEWTFPPVKLAEFKGDLYLLDGFHRIEAFDHVRKELDVLETMTVKAEVTQVRSQQEMAFLAGEANLKHPKPLDQEEKREVFHRYIKDKKHRTENNNVKSLRDMAQELYGMASASTLGRWIKKDFPKLHKEIAKEHPLSGEGKKPKWDRQEELRQIERLTKGAFQAKAAFNNLKSKQGQREAMRILRGLWMELFVKLGENAEFFKDNGVLDYSHDF